jgi:hypothetical protein
MLDIVGSLLFGAICAADVTALISLAAIRPAARFAAFSIAAAWTSLVFAIGALGGFAQGVTGPFPTPVIAFLVLMSGGLVAWFAWPAFRHALLSIPLAGLIGVNASRIVGVFFLILYERGRLAAPFAISAGWGDLITGGGAIFLAGMAVRREKLPGGLLMVWNAFGALDLTAAIILGALSAPGTPFHLLREAPGTLAMGTLPWVGVPTLLVPLYLMTHLTIAARLRALGTGRGQVDNRPQAILSRRAA